MQFRLAADLFSGLFVPATVGGHELSCWICWQHSRPRSARATREELRRIVDALSDEDVAELLEYAHWLQQDSETLTAEEVARVRRGEEQLHRGDVVTWEQPRGELRL